ncbi:alpha/beta hydrolase fold domain-containing protein [Azospirillum soli]|uniref:alpha/beta hydrolase fold domain-containing protein n=1 Tax=Azospirillum soli TaxID=1304799 RepID=UPI001AE6510C|nr:alpha/beta hydrolase fold domain-containing protein [Azospirillum soli]MBP2314306.1 acetyl esterase/lipase [Azospirillum soli]
MVATPQPQDRPEQLSADFKAVLAVRRLFGKPDVAAAQADPAAARARTARFIASFATPGALPRDPADGDGSVGPVRFRRFPTNGAHRVPGQVIYVHGGGLVFHDLDCFAPVLAGWAAAGRSIVGLDYPKAPETKPASIVAAVTGAIAALAETGDEPLVLAGDSIGGLLVLHAALTALAERRPRLVLIHPVLNLDDSRSFPSYEQFGEGYLLDRDFMAWFRALARQGMPPGFDPLALTPGQAALLGEIRLVSAACDMLADEARLFAGQLRTLGVLVDHTVLGGMPHDFILFTQRLLSAQKMVEQTSRIFS